MDQLEEAAAGPDATRQNASEAELVAVLREILRPLFLIVPMGLTDLLLEPQQGQDHLFLQQRDLLFSVGMINPAPQQRPLAMGRKDLQQPLQGGISNRERIAVAWIVERRDSHEEQTPR